MTGKPYTIERDDPNRDQLSLALWESVARVDGETPLPCPLCSIALLAGRGRVVVLEAESDLLLLALVCDSCTASLDTESSHRLEQRIRASESSWRRGRTRDGWRVAAYVPTGGAA